MAWSAPATAVANSYLTAAFWNAQVRDNMLETSPAKATGAGGLIVTTGVNTVTQRTPTSATVGTSESETSTTFTDLATTGPAATVVTGTAALVIVTARGLNASASQACLMGYTISGVSTAAAADSRSLWQETDGTTENNRASAVMHHTGLTAGSNTFTAKYRVTGGTGTWTYRDILVIPL